MVWKTFTPHDVCDKNHERRVKSGVQALLVAVNNSPPERVRICDVQTLTNSLKLSMDRGTDGVQNESLRYLPRRPLFQTFNIFSVGICSVTLEGSKVITLTKSSMDPKFTQIHVRYASCPQRANYSRNLF